MYKDEPLRKYIDDASAGTPTPGGGSVSALAGALGSTMAAMAANFTVGKKKYADVEPRVREILDKLQAGCDRLVEFMQRDTEAYGEVSAAYGMPKDTPEQKAQRTEAIQAGLKTAMAVPLDTVRQCAELLADLPELADIGNPNLISDVGVAAILLEAALRGAKLNVEINLAYMKDEGLVSSTRAEIEDLSAKARDAHDAACDKVATALDK